MNSYLIQYYTADHSANGYAVVAAHSPSIASKVLCSLGCHRDVGYDITTIKPLGHIPCSPNIILCEGCLESGSNGKDGKDGADGLSAYEIAVKHGFEGTEEEWLKSLKADSGSSSAKGTSSAYKKIWYYLNKTTNKYVESVRANDDNIDFVKGTRALINAIGSNEDIFLSTDKGTLMTGGVEVGAYYPSNSISGNSSAIGGLPSMSVSNLKGMLFSELFDKILFPEASAFDNKYTEASIVNNDAVVIVGTPLKDLVTITAPTVGTYGYLSDGSTSKYVLSSWTSPAILDTNAVFGNNEISTNTSTYTISGPSSDSLATSNGTLYLYNSRGTVSKVTPSIIGSKDFTLNSTSATVKGVYRLGVDNNMIDYYQDANGKLCDTLNGTYADSITIPIRIDSLSDASSIFSGATILIPLKNSGDKQVSITLSGKIYTPGADFNSSTKLTLALNSAVISADSNTAVNANITDAQGNLYSYYNYNISIPSSMYAQTLGLLKIYATIKLI